MTLKDYLDRIHDDKEAVAALKVAAEEGREKEFLAAEGVELSNELDDHALSAVAGGLDSGGVSYTAYKFDSRGNETHWKQTNAYTNTYYIFHYECKRCGRILHKGSWGVYYCDPCDTWYWSSDEVIDEQGSL